MRQAVKSWSAVHLSCVPTPARDGLTALDMVAVSMWREDQIRHVVEVSLTCNIDVHTDLSAAEASKLRDHDRSDDSGSVEDQVECRIPVNDHKHVRTLAVT